MNWLLTLLREDEATTAVEYAVMLALILTTIIGSIATVGVGTNGLLSSSKTVLESAGFGS